MHRLLAAIDLGTNTVRLLIGDKQDDGTIKPLLIKRHITRLGGGFTREHGISPEARQRTLRAMSDFSHELRSRDVSIVRAVATSAVRDAVNGESFCREILKETGISVEVIDGREEGVLTVKGVYAGLDQPAGSILVFDVGGGSTEFTLASDGQPLYIKSLPLGVVRLTEGKKSPEAMTEKIERELAVLVNDMAAMRLLPPAEASTLVGTAGTATTLAAISMGMTDYDYRRVNNYSLSLAEIREIRDLLLSLTPRERLLVPGMEQGREDLIIAGILITVATMERFSYTRLKVSDFGLLEGVLYSINDAPDQPKQ